MGPSKGTNVVRQEAQQTTLMVQSTEAPARAHCIGSDLKLWQKRMTPLTSEEAVIMTLRGAESINVIDSTVVSKVVAQIHEYIIAVRPTERPFALLCDGDGDIRPNPDIGSIFGELADCLAEDKSIFFISAQSEGWFGPVDRTDAMKSAKLSVRLEQRRDQPCSFLCKSSGALDPRLQEYSCLTFEHISHA
jgi:hypothetical protein